MPVPEAGAGKVQQLVTPQGVAGVDARREGRRLQFRGFRAGGSPAVASSTPATQPTPATQLLTPVRMLKLNHAEPDASHAHRA